MFNCLKQHLDWELKISLGMRFLKGNLADSRRSMGNIKGTKIDEGESREEKGMDSEATGQLPWKTSTSQLQEFSH